MSESSISCLNFKKVELEDKDLLEKYLYRYGENSCQHCFATMFCMSDKYGDSYCIRDGCLFIHRENLDTSEYRIYLAPMGYTDLSAALDVIILDARYYGKKVRFESITRTFAEEIKALPAYKFDIRADRDLYEYIYTYDKLTRLPGKAFVNKRNDLKHFLSDYEERLDVKPFSCELVPELREFQKKWYDMRVQDENEKYLTHENRVIELAFEYGDRIGITGIVVYIDGIICGYTLGYRNSDNCYDALVEKGDYSIRHIYRFLNMQSVKSCCNGLSYINREEDLGVPGLREAKMSYKPDILVEKFIVTEVS